MISMQYRTYADLTKIIHDNLSILNAEKFDLVVGIPRSGMLPASIISLELNVDLADLKSLIQNTSITRGDSREKNLKLRATWDANKVLLVDDSILTGSSLEKAVNSIPISIRRKLKVLTIYSNEKCKKDVDFILEVVPEPRLFQWNIFHRNILKSSCVDIDGVLCDDPQTWENDDSVNYREFLINAKPKFIPTEMINSLVTNRLEKYRPETETWLCKYNIKYQNLVMLDLESKSERLLQKDYSWHKKNYFKSRSDCLLFIESDKIQAESISAGTGKPVLCIDTNEMIIPNLVSTFTGSITYSKYRLKFFIKRILPSPVIKFLKKWKA